MFCRPEHTSTATCNLIIEFENAALRLECLRLFPIELGIGLSMVLETIPALCVSDIISMFNEGDGDGNAAAASSHSLWH